MDLLLKRKMTKPVMPMGEITESLVLLLSVLIERWPLEPLGCLFSRVIILPENSVFSSRSFYIILSFFIGLNPSAWLLYSSVEERSGQRKEQTGVTILKTIFGSNIWLFHSWPICPFFSFLFIAAFYLSILYTYRLRKQSPFGFLVTLAHLHCSTFSGIRSSHFFFCSKQGLLCLYFMNL